ncbi:hypothetical protein [uncultured Rikenella sp.]|nr:hypothetical protein [uncultured Rikenella sp.]
MDTGYYGYSWSSSVNQIQGQFLNFSSGYLRTSDTNCRAYGLQLRCLSE